MTPVDLDYFVENFEASGFRGPINRYRNQERDFDDLPDMGAAPVHQPSCFIAGSKDVVRHGVIFTIHITRPNLLCPGDRRGTPRVRGEIALKTARLTILTRQVHMSWLTGSWLTKAAG